MKKILLIVLLFCSINTYAIDYYANFVSYKKCINNEWQDWTNWQQCWAEVTFKANEIIVGNKTYTIYSTNTQKDKDCVTILHEAKDYNDTPIVIRIRYQNDGVRQLYLDYKNIIYVYNLIQ